MNQKTFDKFRDLFYEKAGIAINANKIALVTARVGKRMRELTIDDPGDYLKYVMDGDNGEEMVHLLDCISTNVTSFYRERDHFDFLTKLIRQWIDEGQTRIRLWCAAASTGEEPYTLAMTVREAVEDRNIDAKLLATDISTRVLDACRKGEYSEKQVAAIPKEFQTRYFTRVNGHDGSMKKYEAKDELKSMISFSRLNLSQTPFPMKGPFDAIFVRNVMIYFDDAVRKRLLDECQRLLRPGGYLFVGHAETLAALLCDLKSAAPSVYVKN